MWGDEEDSKKVHLVKWSKVTKPKYVVVVTLGDRNLALLCKWSRSFGREKTALWRKVLVAR